jgi:hypothetical protein
LIVRDQPERRQRQEECGERRHDEPERCQPADIGMQPLRGAPTRAIEKSSPSAHAPGRHLHAGQRQDEQCQRRRAGGHASAIAQKEGAVKIGHPALECRWGVGRNRFATGRIDHGRNRSIGPGVERNDLAGGQPLDLLHAGQGAGGPGGQLGHTDAVRGR